MGRNDLCFCGSRLKYKKCHYDIHELSKAARLLKTYNDIDLKIQEHYKNTEYVPPCKPGCANCCSDYFSVSDVEYGMIMYAIQGWDKNEKEEIVSRAIIKTEMFMKSYPEIFNYFEQDSTGDKDKLKILKNIPDHMKMECVFLDKSTKKCKIYNLRPLICRKFGVGYSFDTSNSLICSIIGLEESSRSWQADLREFENEQYRLDYIRLDKDNLIMLKGYPIFYLIYYNHKMNKGFEIPMFNENVRQPEQIQINVFRQFYLRNKML